MSIDEGGGPVVLDDRGESIRREAPGGCARAPLARGDGRSGRIPRAGVAALLNDHLHGGGTERVLSYLSRGFLGARENPLFVFDDSDPAFDYGGTIVGLGVGAPPYDGTFAELRALATACMRLRSAKRRYRVRVCISQKEGPNLVNVLSGGSRSVVTVHEHKSTGMKYRGTKRWLARNLIRAVYNRADRVVVVSREAAHDLSANFGVRPAKLSVIYNPCDADAIGVLAREPIEAGFDAWFDGPTIVTAGRLVTQKGQWHLIRALSRIRQTVPDVRLAILGAGDHLDYLQRLASESGQADRIRFLGYQENPFRFIGRSTLFVLPSLWEGFPACLQEAMACGVPIVSADCPSGPRELLAPRAPLGVACTAVTFAPYGVLVPPLDGRYKSADEPLARAEIELADATVRLLCDRALRERYRTRGLERVREFGIDRYVAQWRALLATL